jgi:hypothetical protein
MDLFDSNTYPRAELAGRCLSCSKELVTVTGPASYRQQFKSMTGARWTGSISLNLCRDFRSLGLDAVHSPDRATLCLICAVKYMQEFNSRLESKKVVG